MKYSLLIILSFHLCFGSILAQEEVMKPIKLLFEGMEKADTSIISKAFDPNVKMFTGYADKTGKEIIHEGSYIEFLSTIANKKKDSPNWIEKLYNTEVKIDGNIAQVWTEYSFYVGEQFVHCGVDAFQLVKRGDEWKIIHLMDTRRKEGCKQD